MARNARAKQATKHKAGAGKAKSKPSASRTTKRAAAKRPARRAPVRAAKHAAPRPEPSKPRDVSHLIGPPLCTDLRRAPVAVLDEARLKDLDEVVVIGQKRGVLYAMVSSGNMVELDTMFRHAWESLLEDCNGARRQILQ